ncbi:hypothetical protein RE6C_04282 [Rhodopirellula europaea 6C]|uniref:Uncharacterized protein n=1 Tax=Rhodopirellula europaea 6C TaxID=1263867 RepID=M2AD40_9BACT|nr:hypothetical protein RE6C_04282 [Rhodopirellula europaea 6C]
MRPEETAGQLRRSPAPDCGGVMRTEQRGRATAENTSQLHVRRPPTFFTEYATD